MKTSLQMQKWEKWLFRLSITALVISGLAQMPLFERYYIASLPGMAWTADYHFNHVLHYTAAAVLLLILFRKAVLYLARKTSGLTLSRSGKVRTAIYAIIIITGFLRALKNLPDFYFSPTATAGIIWLHLTAGLLLGIAALYSFKTKSPYLDKKTNR